MSIGELLNALKDVDRSIEVIVATDDSLMPVTGFQETLLIGPRGRRIAILLGVGTNPMPNERTLLSDPTPPSPNKSESDFSLTK